MSFAQRSCRPAAVFDGRECDCVAPQWFDGHEWDFVFDVDVSDSMPPLKLPMNRGENPYDVADRFMEKHGMPQSYREQIVGFILQNTQTPGNHAASSPPHARLGLP